jgi:hypothetical protein
MVRAFPTNAAIFVGYELSLKLLTPSMCNVQPSMECS